MELTTHRRPKSRRHKLRSDILVHARSSPRTTKLRPAPSGSPPFPSLDFPRRESVSPAEAARRLGCSLQHVYNLIIEGHLPAIDISRPGSARRRRRYTIPVEAWRKFLADHSLQFPSIPQTQKPTSTHPTT